MNRMTRRIFCLAGAGTPAILAAGCSAVSTGFPLAGLFSGGDSPRHSFSGKTIDRPNYEEIYASYPGEPFPIPAVRYRELDQVFLRQLVDYRGPGETGAIVVDPNSRHLYYVEGRGRAMRYGVGVGREGFGWKGEAQINMRRSWPDWIPPSEMIARDPEIRAQLVSTSRGQGVPGGPRNPLGARAMYLFSSSGDTGYRIHGTTEPETIGTDVSSGCIRMINQDVIHLYGRTSISAKVHVIA